MATEGNRYSGDIVRFIGLTITSMGGGIIEMSSMPSMHGEWDVHYLKPKGVAIDILQYSFIQIYDIIDQLVGKPYFTETLPNGFKRANFHSRRFD
ncbi:MAG: hypothetical protein KJT03_12535, partial [Verrucomicrobiae bacterium]|nr:hypothetical protein [Verrucomicrobiae bacterium]